MGATLIADSGSTKTAWTLSRPGKRKKTFHTQGLSPYFLTEQETIAILQAEVLPQLKKEEGNLHFYGTGCGNPANARMIKTSLRKALPGFKPIVETDILGAARATCGNKKGMVCILGTGSSTCYYNGKKIAKSSPGLGFILGDEGSGAYLGKKVLRYYLYNTFEEELMDRFKAKYKVQPMDVLESVYRKPLPNRYLAQFTGFLAENRDHYMVENIIEDGLMDFFFNHIYKFSESWIYPLHFVGSVAHGFGDVITSMCASAELQLGSIVKNPMEGLVKYHS